MNKEEVIAATRDWIEKAVIGLNLCPFAKAVYVKEQVRYVVSEAKHLDGLLEDIDREIDFLAEADPQQVDTTLIMHASLLEDFLDFNDFLDIVDEAVSEQGQEGVIQVAAFHPLWQFAETEPDDIGNYTNRAPFPTIHLLREASVTRAVDAFPEAESIYERNIETLQKLGIDGWRALGLPDGRRQR
ncbi:MAG: DUF1415 domain-containing protein [Methyloversatilis sp.]|jgi:hypothetical protein|nr:DUF1415 domain-containing protein [Methyloversatilis sp.]